MCKQLRMLNVLAPLITKEMEKKYFDRFSRQASYCGNGIYTISSLYSTDTRELFLMYVAQLENITLPKEHEEEIHEE